MSSKSVKRSRAYTKVDTKKNIQIDDLYIHLTVSVGVATISPKATKPEDLFREVDDLLYKAKAKGGNRIVSEGSEK
ncbi:MAG: diguanylate cyclase [Anaerolineae bacterium]|nr:diguanylate cyclase [Anaerolineae bacterium]MBT7069616.1 diguanylate cyclase [Anaerolineae bacterium]MBT7324535.1 diguanylate cyclase [Anaerolineae bacterium]